MTHDDQVVDDGLPRGVLVDSDNIPLDLATDVEPDENVWAIASAGFTSGPVTLRILRWAVSIIGGLAAMLAVFESTPPYHATMAWAMLAAFVPMLALIDFETKYLPNALLYPAAGFIGITAVAGAQVAGEWSALLVAIGCAVAAFLYYGFIWFAAPIGGFGFGDVRLAAILGLTLGLVGAYPAALAIVVAAPLVALAIAGVEAAVNLLRGREAPLEIAFGPAMLLSALAVMLTHGHIPALL